jgi:N-formylglutamate amidohydrolase
MKEHPVQTNKLVVSQRGTMALLLACPHNGMQVPPGVPKRQGAAGCRFATDGDRETRDVTSSVAECVRDLCGLSPYVVIAAFHRRYIDANRPAECAYEVEAAAPYYAEYHATLRAFVDEIRANHEGQGWLLDIHGAAVVPEDPADVYLGTARGASVRRLLDRDPRALWSRRGLHSQLTACGYVVSPSGPGACPPAALEGGYTVRTYGSTQADGIDAVQLEIAAPIRVDDDRRHAFADHLAQAVVALLGVRRRARRRSIAP